MGCRFLLQRIFPTQGLNPGLPHCRQTLYRPSHPEQVASLCPMTKEADSKPRSPHTALLGRKMGQAGDLFLFWSPVFQRRSVGVLKKTLRLRGEQRPALGVEEEDGTAGPGVGGSDDKASACNVGDLGSTPGSRRSSGEGNGNPLQYSCLENPRDRAAR